MELNKEQRQQRLNDLVWEHGVKIDEQANYGELLTQVGLCPDQVTPKMLTKARKAFTVRLAEELNQPEPERDGTIEWSLTPIQEQWRAHLVHLWLSKCTRYRVCRIDGLGGAEFFSDYLSPHGTWDTYEIEPGTGGSNYPKVLSNLDTALQSAERFHCKKFAVDHLTSNREQVVARAKELGLDQSHTRPKQHRIVPVDRFNCVLGSVPAQINAVLMGEPQTEAQIWDQVKELGIPQSLVGTHLMWLYEDELIVTRTIEQTNEVGYATRST